VPAACSSEQRTLSSVSRPRRQALNRLGYRVRPEEKRIATRARIQSEPGMQRRDYATKHSPARRVKARVIADHRHERVGLARRSADRRVPRTRSCRISHVSPAVQVGANRQHRSDELTVLKAPERKCGWSIRRRRNWWKTLVRMAALRAGWKRGRCKARPPVSDQVRGSKGSAGRGERGRESRGDWTGGIDRVFRRCRGCSQPCPAPLEGGRAHGTAAVATTGGDNTEAQHDDGSPSPHSGRLGSHEWSSICLGASARPVVGRGERG